MNTDELTQIAGALDLHVATLIADEAPVSVSTGFSDELVPYLAKPNDPFTGLATDNRYLLTVACDSLTRIGIFRNDVVVVDGDAKAVEKLQPMQAVRVQYHPRPDDFTHAVTLLRQFIPPGLLVTNSGTGNAPPLDLAHDDAQILAVVVSVHRALQG